MGQANGFLCYERNQNRKESPSTRIAHYCEFTEQANPSERRKQAARCMNCGVPFCNASITLGGMSTGCPLHNLIPEWNDALYKGHDNLALSRLLKTNPFPEFTGRVCPALCEKACINGMNGSAVTVRENELYLVEEGFATQCITPRPPMVRSEKRIAIVGSGPAGLAVAEKLNRRGHLVTVYERDDRFGGLLMYGIPNMKLDKKVVERRINLMKEEGVTFLSNQDVGKTLTVEMLAEQYDAVVLCCGAKQARDIQVEGREANGVYFAVDFLKRSTQHLLNPQTEERLISAKDKRVIVLGGGDTGNDCVAISVRQGAKLVTQLEIMPQLPKERLPSNPWPEWPKVETVDYGQEEARACFGKDPREYQKTVKKIHKDDKGNMVGVTLVDMAWQEGKLQMVEGSENYREASLLLIAAGFTGAETYTAPTCALPSKQSTSFQTDQPKVFACGDMKKGQSLVVWAIEEGVRCAHEVDQYLMGL